MLLHDVRRFPVRSDRSLVKFEAQIRLMQQQLSEVNNLTADIAFILITM
jgi:hypothetical protein